jgi:nicotinamide-nucleotide amidase
MICSIISIGTELNLGLIVDMNSRYIAERLTDIGIECRYMFTVNDNIDDISDIIKYSLKYTDLVIISGGLGPTDDDVTRAAVALALNSELIRDKSLDKTSLKFFISKKKKEVVERLLRQSYIPSNSIPLKPKLGSAPGFILETKNDKFIICIPGVPKEMRNMFEDDVIPFLRKIIKGRSFKKGILKIRKSTLLTTDISETEIEEKIKEIVGEAKKMNVEVGITAEPGLIKVILIAKAYDDLTADKNLKVVEKKITVRLGDCFYGKEGALISDNLKETIERTGEGLTISTAESITGGLISSIITDTPGSSKFFLGGIISYSDYSKVKLLGVDKNELAKRGAVTRKVCFDMAKKAMEIFKSDYSMSVTGYAGPEPGDNKVGLVYCCILGPGGYKKIFRKFFSGTRSEIKFRTAQFMIKELNKAINNRFLR